MKTHKPSVDILVERRVPLAWQEADVKRVLGPAILLKRQLLLLPASVTGKVSTADLMRWTDRDPKEKYFPCVSHVIWTRSG